MYKRQSQEYVARVCTVPTINRWISGSFGSFVSTTIAGLLIKSFQTKLLALSYISYVLVSFAATFIGRSINFVAIVKLLQLPSEKASTTVAIEMTGLSIYITTLFVLELRVNRGKRTSI